MRLWAILAALLVIALGVGAYGLMPSTVVGALAALRHPIGAFLSDSASALAGISIPVGSALLFAALLILALFGLSGRACGFLARLWPLSGNGRRDALVLGVGLVFGVVLGGLLLFGQPALAGALAWLWGTVVQPVATSPWTLVFLFGAGVGTAELAARYKDDPIRVMVTLPAVVYIVINGLAAVAALDLIRRFDVLNDSTAPGKSVAEQVLLAGFGAMAFFRSAIFTVRVGNDDVAVGPAGMLQVILQMVDQATDRQRGAVRARLVEIIMDKVSFERAKQALPALCCSLLQNLPERARTELAQTSRDLGSADMDDRQKALVFGLYLMNTVGADVLREAVEMLKASITVPEEREQFVTALMSGLSFSAVGEVLPEVIPTLMEKPADDETKRIRGLASVVDGLPLSDGQKVVAFGLRLVLLYSKDVLRQAVGILKSTTQASGRPPIDSMERLYGLLAPLSYDRDGRNFVQACFAIAGLSGEAVEKELASTLDGVQSFDPPARMAALAQAMVARFGKDLTIKAIESLAPPPADPAGPAGGI